MHNERHVAQLAASLQEWGWTNPVLVDEEGNIIAGHGRVMAAKKLGYTEVPVIVAHGWTNAQKRAYIIADNKLALNATWDEEILAVELDELRDAAFDLELVGFDVRELNDLIGTPNTGPEHADKGSLLALTNITIEDPIAQVSAGDQWTLGAHVLVVCSVVEDWETWLPLLTQQANGAGTLFCPFPGPFVLGSERAKTHRLLLVQPDPYIAGHIIDRYKELFGGAEVECVVSGS